MPYKNNLGFTILELMIVVGIILILATIALPAYQNYGKKAKRSEAKTALLALKQQQEKYRANHVQYTSTITDIGSASSEHGYYTLSIANATATTYTLTATATGEQAGDTDCATLSITQDDVKTSTGNASVDCWK